MNILIDADAIFALAISTDPNHRQALNLIKKNRAAVVSILNTTIAEVATVLFRKVSHQAAMRFLRDLESGDSIIISADKKLMDNAILFFEKQTTKNITFFDCLNMAAMEAFNFEAIFSFDKGYSKNGFKLLKEI